MKENNRIIIAENEQIITEDLKKTLEGAGYVVIATASTGEEAIEKVKELKPDIVILDIYLTGETDGKATAEQIKEFSDCKIMFYSTCNDIETLRTIKSVSEESEIDQNGLLFSQDDDIQIASNIDKIVSKNINQNTNE